jgi:hypothetical protein
MRRALTGNWKANWHKLKNHAICRNKSPIKISVPNFSNRIFWWVLLYKWRSWWSIHGGLIINLAPHLYLKNSTNLYPLYMSSELNWHSSSWLHRVLVTTSRFAQPGQWHAWKTSEASHYNYISYINFSSQSFPNGRHTRALCCLRRYEMKLLQLWLHYGRCFGVTAWPALLRNHFEGAFMPYVSTTLFEENYLQTSHLHFIIYFL